MVGRMRVRASAGIEAEGGEFRLAMAVALDMRSADFDERFQALIAAKRESSADVDLAVADIIDDVRRRGDAALAELSLRFDRVELGRLGLKIRAGEIDAAIGACDKTALEALKLAHARVMDFHLRQKPADVRYTDPLGVELGWRWRPIDAVGLYVPGGAASYPSSVIMNAVPAKVAGCRRLAMVMPAPDGETNLLALAAARIAGVDEIYRVGGAQAIAALAYGTETILPVEKIVGPGNAYVAAAKRRVFGAVGIDMIAGPSEVVVLADSSADPRFVAADLLAQAEHDEAAQSILVTDDTSLAREVEAEMNRQLESLPRAGIAGESWRLNGAVLLCPSLEAAVPLVDRLAPEHLEIMANEPEALADKISNAGAIFLGPHTPEAIGDYVGGSNHVLPTARSARFSSGLGVLDFMKRTSLLKCDARSLEALGPAAVTLGKAEGLEAHARSVAMRLRANSP
jgi:histidinol dehydrogenase